MSASEVMGRVLTGVLAVCCVTVTAISVKQQFFRPVAPLPPRPTQPATGRLLPPGAPQVYTGARIGPASAPLQIVEIADFECPFCAVSSGQVEEILKKYPGMMSITYKHLIIPGHAHSRAAALASECAGAQGVFEAYYHELYSNRNKLGKRSWESFAKAAKVPDLKSFNNCVETERFASRIVDDSVMTVKLNISATPTWIIGDSAFGGAPSMLQLEEWVTDAIERKKRAGAASAGQ